MIKKNVFIIVVFFFLFKNNYVRAQATDLSRPNQDTSLVNKLNNEIKNLKQSDPFRALDLTKKNLALAARLHYYKGQIRSVMHLITIYNSLGFKDSTIRSIKIAELLLAQHKDIKSSADVCFYKGTYFQQNGNYDSTAICYYKALNLYTKVNDPLSKVKVLLRLEAINNHLYYKKQGFEYGTDALIILKSYPVDSTIQTDAYFLLTTIYIFKNQIDSAYNFNYLALRFCPANNLTRKCAIYSQFGDLFRRQEKYDSAFFYFSKSTAILEKLKIKTLLIYNKVSTAIVLFKEKKVKSAEKMGLEALALAEENKNTAMAQSVCLLLSNINISRNNYREALEFYSKHIEYRDSLVEKQNRKQMFEISTKYETEKKDAQIVLLNMDKLLSQQEAQRQYYIKIFISVFALFFVILAAILFYNYRQKNKSNQLLSLQKNQIEEKNNQLEKQQNNISLQNLQLENRNQLITDSIEYARKIQDSMLPNEKILSDYFSDAFIYYQPKDIVSGDFYWFRQTSAGITLALGDCTGHGVPGALMSILGQNSLDSAYKEFPHALPLSVFGYLDTHMKQRTQNQNNLSGNIDGMALSLVEYNKKNKSLNYALAKQYIYLVRNNELTEIKGSSFSIGSRQSQPIVSGEIKLQNDDVLFLFSDGYPDQKGGPLKRKFMYPKLKALLTQISGLPATEQQFILESEMENWKGAYEQIDDILVVGLRV